MLVEEVKTLLITYETGYLMTIIRSMLLLPIDLLFTAHNKQHRMAVRKYHIKTDNNI